MTDWVNAHDATDAHIERLRGMATVLHEVTKDWEHLNNPDPLAYGVLTMISTIHDGMDQLTRLREDEWRAKKVQA